jgi:hypothetical protein
MPSWQSRHLGGPVVLNSTTVHDAGAADILIGGAALDWFYASSHG